MECKTCNHTFSYTKMVVTFRNITCPSCGTKYKVDVKSKTASAITVVLGILSIGILHDIYPNTNRWVSIVTVLVIVFLIAPFNQKLIYANKNS